MSISACKEIKESLINNLLATQCIKYGQFVLKSGDTSSYYVNLREATMHSDLFRDIIRFIKIVIEEDILKVSKANELPIAIVGVPYGVVPIAAAVAYAADLHYYPIRKETKDYGYKSDESFYLDHNYILIEDVMSTGSSIIETLKKMEYKKVTDVIVIVNRESGGDERLKKEYPGLRLHSLLRVSELSSIDNKCSVLELIK